MRRPADHLVRFVRPGDVARGTPACVAQQPHKFDPADYPLALRATNQVEEAARNSSCT
jgi:hypothetical protein